MRHPAWSSLVALAAATLFVASALGQDSDQSLGDVARKTRQQKQTQSKDASGKEGKTPMIITNEQLPEHVVRSSNVTLANRENNEEQQIQQSSEPKLSASQWKSQIVSQKNQVAALQSQIDRLNDSIHFAPANCVSNCVQWNERQKEKQQQVEQMNDQLTDQKKRLEDMQDSARQQGYGSSVYEP